MIQKIHYSFFCLYNLSYKDGFGLQEKTSGKAFDIEQRPIFVLCLSSWLWTLFIRLLIVGIFNPSYKILPIKHYEILIPILFFGIYYFYFIDNKLYLDLYNKYKMTDKYVQRKDSKKIIFFLLLPIAMLIITGYIMAYYLNIDLHTLLK